MTKKRFKLREEIDFFDNGRWITHGEVVDLLNKLNDENKALKQQILDKDLMIHTRDKIIEEIEKDLCR